MGMIAANRQASTQEPPTSGGFSQLRIELEGLDPAIWRRLIVPSNANFGWLHRVIQIAMGWTDSHLHDFQVGEKVISDPVAVADAFEGRPAVLNEAKVRLNELVTAPGESFGYEYDYGDSWNHRITVEVLSAPEEAVAGKAVCLAGARSCPPEDCGGVDGYVELLKALKNRKHPDHKAMKEWLGRPFDGEAFSVGETNVHLAKLRWPKVTEAAFRRILLDRLGIEE
jgi:Plasmid pRiA4b ORF-3-like protein